MCSRQPSTASGVGTASAISSIGRYGTGRGAHSSGGTGQREVSEEVGAVVADIIEEVRRRGDAAVLEYTSRFDALDLTSEGIRIGGDEIAAARAQCDAAALTAMETAADRIRAFHERLKPQDRAWLPLGQFVPREGPLQITHGICPACRAMVMS